MKRSLVWFKTDLRLHDNETLLQAIAQSNEIIPVYCLDESLTQTTPFGFKKMGHFRAQFLLQALQNLDQNYCHWQRAARQLQPYYVIACVGR